MDEETGLLDLTRAAFPLLPDGSRVEITSDDGPVDGADPLPGALPPKTTLRSACLEWAHRWMPR